MNKERIIHLVYCPWTGLGLFGGFRGNRWLRNRIKVFKQFVIPSLQAQTTHDFTLWCSWRPEEKKNPLVQELVSYLAQIEEFKTIHTFHGVCFWDDKYPDEVARARLINSLHSTLGELIDVTGGDNEYDSVLMTIQPSDDCYHKQAFEGLRNLLTGDKFQAAGFTKGYLMNYLTKELVEYNPKTNPPFFTIKFKRDVFIDALKHLKHTGPYQSHEYVPNFLRYASIEDRGFLVGTHGENISTTFVHPYGGATVPQETLKDFGLDQAPKLEIRTSIRRSILSRLPHKVQRKLRYWIGERFWQGLYEFLRG